MRAAWLLAAATLAAACQLMPIFDEKPGPRCDPGEAREAPCGVCEAGTGFEVCGEDGRWRPPLLCEGNRYDADSDGVASALCFAEGRSCCGADRDCDDGCPTCFPGGLETPGNDLDEDCSGSALDVDGDGHAAIEDGGEDCDDGRSDRHPGHARVCGDGLDHDCDGLVDELGGCGACAATGLGAPRELAGFLSRGLFVSAGVAFVASDQGLRVVGLGAGSELELLATVDCGPARAAFRGGDRLYLAASEALRVLDLAEPEAPTLLDEAVPLERPRGLFVTETHAWVAGLSGLDVFALGGPGGAPTRVASDPTAGSTSLFVVGDRVVVGGPERCVAVLDGSDPAAPGLLFGAEVYGRCDGDGVFVSGSRVFAASTSLVPGLHGFELGQDRLEPLAEPTRTGPSRAVFVASDRAYVAGEDGLYLVDVSRPEAPVLLLHRPTALGRAVFVSGPSVLVGTEEGLTAFPLECPH